MIEIGNLFTGTKWEIISHLAVNPHSPLELATKLNTTIANISQQLRLLEAAGLVRTEKTRESERGKPRVLYSIAKDLIYTINLQKGAAEKKLIAAEPYQNVISRIWQLKDSSVHKGLIRFYFDIEKELDKIEAIGIDEISGTVLVAGNKAQVKTAFAVKFLSLSQFEKEKEIFVIYRRGGLR